MKNKLAQVFPAFRHKNYRIYFIGQLVSLSGTWLQIVAEGWLVFNLTHSAFLVGLVSAIGTLPFLIFAPFAGVIVDRFSKRKILIWTQIFSCLFALILAILTLLNIITVYHIAILAFLLTLSTAIDVPARQAFMIEMVGGEDLASAVALQAGIFNAARIIGPTFAGLLIAAIGTGGTFLLNAISFIPLAIAFVRMKVRPLHSREHEHPLKALIDGVRYSFTHPLIGLLLVYTAFSSIFGWSYATIMPVITKSIFHRDAAVLGYLFASAGVGAIIATFLISAYAKVIKERVFIIAGSLLAVIALIGFSFTDDLIYAFPLLFLNGMGLVASFATAISLIQHKVNHLFRGRVMSLHLLMFAGMFPVGNFLIGWLADNFGTQGAIRINCTMMVIVICMLYLNRKRLT